MRLQWKCGNAIQLTLRRSFSARKTFVRWPYAVRSLAQTFPRHTFIDDFDYIYLAKRFLLGALWQPEKNKIFKLNKMLIAFISWFASERSWLDPFAITTTLNRCHDCRCLCVRRIFPAFFVVLAIGASHQIKSKLIVSIVVLYIVFVRSMDCFAWRKHLQPTCFSSCVT